jgi:PAS domain S-box-containing protein
VIFRYRLWPVRGLEFVSQSVTRMIGYTTAEFYADPELGFKVIHPDDRAMFQEMTSDPLKLERPVVLRWVRKDGAIIWVEIRGTIIRDSAGRAFAIQGVSRDVSERVRGEERLRSIVEGSIQGILVHRDQKPLFVNDAYAHMYGYATVEEVLSLDTVGALVAPEERERIRGYGRDRLAGRAAPTRYEFRALRKDGSPFWVEHMARVIAWEDQPAILATFVDITARKEAEEALRLNEQRHRLLTENAQDCIFRYNLVPERGFDYVSPASLPLCGYAPVEYYGDPELPLKLVHSDDRHILENYFRNPAPEPVTLTLRLRRKDGTLIWTEHRNALVLDADGRAVGIEGSVRDITERMQGEELFRLVVESAPAGLAIVDGEGKIVQVNTQLERDFGYSRDELTGQAVEILMPERTREDHVPLRNRYLASPRPRPMGAGLKLRGRRKDGSEFPVDISLSPFATTQGNLVLAAIQDITERKRAEDELRRSEARFRGVIEQTSMPMMVHRDFHPLFVNEAYARLFGFQSREQVMGMPDVLGTVVPEERDVQLGVHRSWIGGTAESQPFERQALRADGTRFWVQAILTRIEFEGAPAVLASYVDITDRKRAEEQLRSQQSLLQAVLDSVPQWISVKDREGRFLLVNRQLAQDNRQPAEWFRGKQATELLWGADEEKAKLLELDASALSAGGMLSNDAVALMDPEHRPHVFSTVRVPLRDSAGQTAGLVTIAQDITEQRLLQEQFTASQKMEAVGRLAGGVAHDFNNILAVILSYSHFVLDQLPAEGTVRGDLNEVLAAAERAAGLTRQLLAFSRKQTLQLRVIDLNEVIENLGNMLRRLIGEDIDFITRLDLEPWPVRADVGQIEQVIMNLAVNARDAMPGGGKLIVETRNAILDEEYVRQHLEAVPGEFVQMTVSDTGTGMDEVVRKRIFEPFFTTKEQGKGTGLGLATVYGIVKQLEGFIWVYSEPGKGTSFKIYLPRCAEGEQAKGGNAPPAEAYRGSEIVLLVEDNEPVRRAARRILENHGYRVLEAEDTRHALALCEDGAVHLDLLLSDVVMPVMSGPELAERVRTLRPELPVVFMSGYTDDAMSHHGIDAGQVRLLQKPFTSLSLLKLLREVLDQARGEYSGVTPPGAS